MYKEKKKEKGNEKKRGKKNKFLYKKLSSK
jgi:hypothetical protein